MKNGPTTSQEKAGPRKIGIIVGSLRRESFSRKVAKSLVSLLPEDMEAHWLAIGDLAMYNQDLDDDGETPASWQAFRDEVERMDAFLFVTPEYNRSIPPVLKNALDIASRPYGYNRWSGKPGAVVSASPGAMGGFGANHILRQSLMFLNTYTMQQPEAYIGNCAELFGPDEKPPETTANFFQDVMDAFVAWVRVF